MNENQPYVPSPEEFKKAANSMGVKQKLMSEMRAVDVADSIRKGVPIETLAKIKYNKENNSYVINNHVVKLGPGDPDDVLIDGERIRTDLANAFHEKYIDALYTMVEGDVSYEAIADRTISKEPDLRREVSTEDQMRDERIAKEMTERGKSELLDELDAILS